MSTTPQRSRTRLWVIMLLIAAAGAGALLATRPVIITSALGSPQAILVNAAIGAVLLAVAVVLHRRRAPLVLRAVILGVPVLALLAWTVLPAFRTVRVDEALPGQAAPAAPASTASAEPSSAPPGAADTQDLAQGSFTGLDGHDARGIARLISVDGATILRLEDFSVTNGPDLRVVLTTAPGSGAAGGTDLGALKGNEGNQNYEIPAEVDLDTIGSVLIWCRAFNVDFGEAPLQR